ncbi:CLUMA_CG007171, isoform A [Clunio marinus]|uniref:CLUMA_CG007171, isoform A n=1 Tax=Clunio marinus TaxID=568069 RepID=A0A1J1I1L5_9DIPT|nr:CLUMA_CG007171, isoform A [Clunio marinus]
MKVKENRIRKEQKCFNFVTSLSRLKCLTSVKSETCQKRRFKELYSQLHFVAVLLYDRNLSSYHDPFVLRRCLFDKQEAVFVRPNYPNEGTISDTVGSLKLGEKLGFTMSRYFLCDRVGVLLKACHAKYEINSKVNSQAHFKSEEKPANIKLISISRSNGKMLFPESFKIVTVESLSVCGSYKLDICRRHKV